AGGAGAGRPPVVARVAGALRVGGGDPQPADVAPRRLAAACGGSVRRLSAGERPRPPLSPEHPPRARDRRWQGPLPGLRPRVALGGRRPTRARAPAAPAPPPPPPPPRPPPP